MSENLGKAILTIETDSTKFDAGVDKAEGKASKLGGTFSKTGAVVGVFSGVLAGAAVGALSDAANAAAADEASTLALQQAIENSGVAFEDHADAINAAIKAGQDLAFSDDATRASLQGLTESTGSVDEAMKRLPIAMDLARAKHISLEAASKLLGKVSDENTKALKKYGIVMEEGATATDVLAKVQQVAGGQALIYGNSTKGSIDKVKDSIGEFTEGIGASLGPFQGMIALMPGLQSGMLLASGAIGGLSSALGIQRTGMMLTIPVAGGLNVALGPLILVIGAIALAAGLLALAWSNNWGDIQGKTAAVFSWLGDAFEGVKSTIERIWNAIGPILQAGLGFILAPIQTIIGAVQGAIGLLQRLGILQAESTAMSNVDYNQRAGERSSIAAAGGFEGMVTRPTTFSVAEDFKPEYVSITPGGRGGVVDRPIVIENYMRLEVEGRVLASAVNRREADQARSVGIR